MLYTTAHSKYQRIKQRSFVSFLDLFLICIYTSDKSLLSANIENFQLFNYNDSRIPEARGAYQLAKNSDEFCDAPISELDKAIQMWQKENDIAHYKNVFSQEKIISESI